MNKSKNAVAAFNKYASEYQNKYMYFDSYDDTFDLFCEHIKTKNASVLEIACGPGNITKYLLNKNPVLNILGIDLAENMLALARNNNPDAEYRLLDGRNISQINKTYDAIMCGFCLPYLNKEEAIKLISDASKILNPGGVIYLSTMEDDYGKSDYRESSTYNQEKIFIYYHEADYLCTALKENGFKLLDIIRKDFPEQDGSITKDLVIIADK